MSMHYWTEQVFGMDNKQFEMFDEKKLLKFLLDNDNKFGDIERHLRDYYANLGESVEDNLECIDLDAVFEDFEDGYGVRGLHAAFCEALNSFAVKRNGEEKGTAMEFCATLMNEEGEYAIGVYYVIPGTILPFTTKELCKTFKDAAREIGIDNFFPDYCSVEMYG